MGRIGLAEQKLDKPLRDELERWIDRKGLRAKNDSRNVGRVTRARRKGILFRVFAELASKHPVKKATSLRDVHVRFLVDKWVNEGKSPSTIQNNLSVLRMFAEWIGKKGMVGPCESYVTDKALVKRSVVTKTNRSWAAAGIDVHEVIKKAEQLDPRTGLMLQLMHAFGLRMREAVCLKPMRDVVMDGQWLSARDGTKGGRQRMIPVETDYQRKTLAWALELADKKTGCITKRGLTIDAAIDRLQNHLTKLGVTKKDLGVTAHGLRHQYAQEAYKKLAGQPSPICGGDPAKVDRETHVKATLETMERLGHSRTDVGGSYYGSYGHALRKKGGNSLSGTPDVTDATQGDTSWINTLTATNGRAQSIGTEKRGAPIAKHVPSYATTFGFSYGTVRMRPKANSIAD